MEQMLEGLRASSGLDVGVETLQAHSFTVADAREVFTHGRTGAKTGTLKITRKDKLTPLSFQDVVAQHSDDAKFLVNTQSGRAVLQVPSLSRMTEEGAVQPCVRLIRPLNSDSMTRVELAASKWDRMSKGSLRIYRLQTDDGRRLLGRVLHEKDLPAFYTALGLEAPRLTPEALWASVLDDGTSHSLARGLRLRCSRVMAENRVELSFNGGSDIFATLTGFGCMTEIIQYKRRACIPVNAQGPAILAKVLDRFQLMGA